jgi:hypothetical protein
MRSGSGFSATCRHELLVWCAAVERAKREGAKQDPSIIIPMSGFNRDGNLRTKHLWLIPFAEFKREKSQVTQTSKHRESSTGRGVGGAGKTQGEQIEE